MFKKKIISTLLMVSMLITFMPSMTFAAANKFKIQATATNENTVKVSWNKISKATKYVVYGKEAGKKYKKLSTLHGKKKAYVVKKISGKKLKKSKNYSFYVVAYKGKKKLAKSNVSSAKVTKEKNDAIYTLAYEPNGGTGTMSKQEFKIGDLVPISSNKFTAPEGKEFKNWNTMANGKGTSYESGTSIKFMNNIVLYAQWREIEGNEESGGGPSGSGDNIEEKNITVLNQSELDSALNNIGAGTINIITSAENLRINGGNYQNVILNVNAPNCHFDNKANFKSVNILAISNSTWVECAKGNTINYSAGTGHIKVSADARCSINALSGAGKLDLTNDGNVSSLTLNTQVEVSISGDSSAAIQTAVKSGATGSKITTNLELSVNAEAKCNLIIGEGAEYTDVTAKDTSCIPSLSGLGRIEVNNTDTGDTEFIVCKNDNSIAISKKVYIKGRVVFDTNNISADGVQVFLVPYTDGIDEGTVLNNFKSTTSDADGKYKIEDIEIGNYALLFKKNEYATVVKTLILTSNNIEGYKVEDTRLIQIAQEGEKGTLRGSLIDAKTGDPVERGLTVQLRKGQNNMSGTADKTVLTNDDGEYTFEDLEYGYYTITVLDKRENSDTHYLTVSFLATVSSSDSVADGTVTGELSNGQVRFVLTWGSEETGASADIDSHLVGPRLDGGGNFHTWFADKVYGEEYYDDEEEEYYYREEEKYADLDVDVVDWEGPETTTIYQPTDGTYSFYIHDFTNRFNSNTNQLSRSDAVVKAYVGKKLKATYNVPDGVGTLWHVCDYDSKKNKFIEKGNMDYWPIDEEYIGLDDDEVVMKMKENISDLIENISEEMDRYHSNELKQYIQSKIEGAISICNESNDRSQLMQTIEELNDIRNIFNISKVTMNDDNGDDLIEDWSYYFEDDHRILKLYSMLPEFKDTLCVSFSNEDAEGVYISAIEDTTDYNCNKKITITYKGESCTYYIKLAFPNWLYDIDDVIMVDDDGNDLIDNWESFSIDDNNYILEIYTLSDLNDTLQIIFGNDEATVSQIEDTSEHGCTKKISILYEGITINYYIRSELPDFIAGVKPAMEDEFAHLLIDGADYERRIDNGELYYELCIYTLSELNDTLRMIPHNEDAVVSEIVDTNEHGCIKTFTVSYNGRVREYFVRCEKTPWRIFGIDSVSMLDEQSNELIKDWDKTNYDDYSILTLYTFSDIDNLNITKAFDDAYMSPIEDTNEHGCTKKFSISYEGETKTYYIKAEIAPWMLVEGYKIGSENVESFYSIWTENGESAINLYTLSKLDNSLEIIVARTDVSVLDIRDTTRYGCTKMVKLDYEGKIYKLYLKQDIRIDMLLDDVTMFNGQGENLIEDWYSCLDYDEDDDNEYRRIVLVTDSPLNNTLNFITKSQDIKAIIEDTTLYGCTKKLLLKFNDTTFEYYIDTEEPYEF